MGRLRGHFCGTRDRFTIALVLVAAFAACLARATAIFSEHDFPHVMDEAAYVLQAKMFASGHLSVPEVRPYAAFNQWFVQDHGSRHGIFPPGWPLLLALGYLIHIPEWINPLLHGAAVLLLGLLGRSFFGRRAGLLAAVLLATSPQAVLLAGSLMSHTMMALLAVIITSGLLARLLGRGRLRLDLVSGAALGVAAATRPLCALVLLAMALIGFYFAWRHRRVHARSFFCWGLAALPFVVLLGFYNHTLTGHAIRFPQSVYFDEHLSPVEGPIFRYGPGCNGLGFGFDRGCELWSARPGHDTKRAIANTRMNLQAWFNLTGAWGIIPLAAIVALWCGRHRGRQLLLLAPWLGTVFAYSLYWNPGTCYGARFYHVGLPGLLLAAAGVITCSRMVSRLLPLIAVVVVTLFFVELNQAGAEVANGYWGTDARFREWSSAYEGPNALVLVAFQTHHRRVLPSDMKHTAPGLNPQRWTNGIRFQSAMAMNSPAIDGRLIFAKYHPALTSELRWRFPSREVLIYVMGDDSRDDVVLPIDQLRLANAQGVSPPVDNFNGSVLGRGGR
jgi:hypothetical protein